jgi:hypothetical protein
MDGFRGYDANKPDTENKNYKISLICKIFTK